MVVRAGIEFQIPILKMQVPCLTAGRDSCRGYKNSVRVGARAFFFALTLTLVPLPPTVFSNQIQLRRLNQ